MTAKLNFPTFEQLFYTKYKLFVQGSYRIVGDIDVAQDLVQDVFCKYWEKQEELNIHISVEAYLYQSVINHSLNYLKKVKRNDSREELFYTETSSEQQNNIENQLALKETNQLLQRAMATLPAGCKTVFVLSRFEQLNYKQIAEKLDISTKTVENQIGKALKHLRKYLGLII